jgi:hypothetical protein
MSSFAYARRARPTYQIWVSERSAGRRALYKLMVNYHDLHGWQMEGTVAADQAVVVARQVELEEEQGL